ncbi:hypothetical protein L6452_14623 [Arctium lappa]|uniref:Uncharacterized protein n=1 Tax=Arctium lappa TaxID=4217 RepID=A0ACB9CLL8_ARCLA|nr:hypothetical protein L6452_14623 [Arctium lappa]
MLGNFLFWLWVWHSSIPFLASLGSIRVEHSCGARKLAHTQWLIKKVSDDKAMETKASNAIDFEQMEEATHLESETDTVMSEIPVEHVPCNSDVRHCDDSAHGHESESLKDVGVDQLVEPELGIDKNVGKIRFDLNLQPAADMQTMDDDDDGSVSNDCKNPFEPSESRAHDSKSCAAQPLVLVCLTSI